MTAGRGSGISGRQNSGNPVNTEAKARQIRKPQSVCQNSDKQSGSAEFCKPSEHGARNRLARYRARRSVDRLHRLAYCPCMDIASTKKTNLHVDPNLWMALRVRALQDGVSATEALNRAIAAYVKQPLPRPKKKRA